jgi:hypothetical protein
MIKASIDLQDLRRRLYVKAKAVALGKARERRIRDESVKPLKEVQPVKVRLGQSLSRQAGSECCLSPGDWRVRSVHSKEAGREGFSSDIAYDRDADAVSLAEGSIQTTDKREVALRSPESLARGMLSSGLPVNPGELSTSPEPGESVQPDPNGTRSQGSEGVPREANRPSTRSTCHQGRPEAVGRGRRAVVRTHSTREGGEPQGSRKGRPRYPLEGRGKQVDASTRSRIRETQNSRTDVKWNTVD